MRYEEMDNVYVCASETKNSVFVSHLLLSVPALPLPPPSSLPPTTKTTILLTSSKLTPIKILLKSEHLLLSIVSPALVPKCGEKEALIKPSH